MTSFTTDAIGADDLGHRCRLFISSMLPCRPCRWFVPSMPLFCAIHAACWCQPCHWGWTSMSLYCAIHAANWCRLCRLCLCFRSFTPVAATMSTMVIRAAHLCPPCLWSRLSMPIFLAIPASDVGHPCRFFPFHLAFNAFMTYSTSKRSPKDDMCPVVPVSLPCLIVVMSGLRLERAWKSAF